MSAERRITLARRLGRVAAYLAIVVLLAAGTLVALGFGMTEFFAYVDVHSVYLTELPEHSAGRWELDEVVGLDASHADWFGDEIELRWDEVATVVDFDDDRPVAMGTLVRHGRAHPIEMNWRDRVPAYFAGGLDRRGGEAIDERPELAILVRRSERGWFETLYVLPHGIDAWNSTGRSLRYTRVD